MAYMTTYDSLLQLLTVNSYEKHMNTVYTSVKLEHYNRTTEKKLKGESKKAF